MAGGQSIPAARVQARRSVIFADAPAVHGPPPTFQGAIFDVDGVLVDSPHYRAWRDALQELMVSSLACPLCQAVSTGGSLTSPVRVNRRGPRPPQN